MDCKEDVGVFGEERSLESQRWRTKGTGCVVRRVLSVGERSENSKKLFQIFRQGVNEVPIASMAKENVGCTGEEMPGTHGRSWASNERQEVLTIQMEGKVSMQKVAPEDFQRQIFEDLKELEEQKTMEALELVTRKHKLVK